MTKERTDSLIARAENYLEEHKNQKASITAQELAQMEPNDAIVWFVKGKVHYMMEEYDEALSALSKAASIEQERTEIWHVLGYTLIALRRYEEAREALEYVASAREDDAQAYASLAAVCTILQDEQAARQALTRAIQLDAKEAHKVIEHFYIHFVKNSNAVDGKIKNEIESYVMQLAVK